MHSRIVSSGRHALVVATALAWPALALGAPQDPPSAPVTVVNKPANPVPVSGTLNVANTPDNPLAVSGNINVTNSILNVEALNDQLSVPYFHTRSSSFAGGDSPQFLSFDIPTGKRLIVENITVRAALNTTSNLVAGFQYQSAQTGSETGYLSLQAQGPITGSFGDTTYWLVGTHPVKVRLDAVEGKTDELSIFLQRGVVGGTWNVSVAGYLVPLP